MTRVTVLFVALLLGAAAPARAWCEATCLAPSDVATPHCPTPESTPDKPSIAATANADCPAIESARPIPARVDLLAGARLPAGSLRALAPLRPGPLASSHPTIVARHLSHTGSLPLRI